MKLIIGGYAAGKKAVALNLYGLEAQKTSPLTALSCPCIDQLHELIRQVLEQEGDCDAFIDSLMADNPRAIVLCDEVGLGVIPAERNERAWREAVGRACCRIAAQADEVIRVVCGLEQRLK